jgi:alpha-D-ribose 1-methylphosphonate 5-triphosphate diphosphatase
MFHDLVLTHARLVLPDRILSGTLHVSDGLIASVDAGLSLAAADSLDGDLLIPGIVDLHTDNLERQVMPRIAARWPSRSAFLAHDAQCAAAGITTVLDAFSLGDLGYDQGRNQTFRDGLADGGALAALGLLKADHLLHLRCELPAPDLEELFLSACDHPRLRLVSLMDHTPGFGQYGAVDGFRRVRQAEGMNDAAIDTLIDYQRSLRETWRSANRDSILAHMSGRDVVMASHDDRTASEIEDNHACGIGVSEFPVTLEAARAARARGMRVVAGAPNLVRGGSHSGNLAVAALLAEHLVDALASDYVPSSLIEAVFRDARTPAEIAASVARVTDNPARLTGLHDRGRLEAGLRADLVQVHLPQGMPDLPVIRRVWRQGRRVI